jgi:hypothetical protein
VAVIPSYHIIRRGPHGRRSHDLQLASVRIQHSIISDSELILSGPVLQTAVGLPAERTMHHVHLGLG